MARVVFTPSGLEGNVEPGTTVLDAAREFGVDVDSVCGGRGICGRCQVVTGEGNFPKWGMTVDASAVSAPNSIEQDYAGKRPIVEGQRLGCATQICSDVVIDVPEASQIHKQVVRKEVEVGDVTLDPVVELRYLEPSAVVLGDDATATDLIAASLAADWEIEGAVVAHHVLGQLNRALDHVAADGEADGVTVAVQAAVEQGKRQTPPTVVAIWPGFVDVALGVAVDVGSTTVAGHLCDLTTGDVLATAGRMNPQIRFGEDLMSRVSYVMMNPGGDQELTGAIRTALDALIGELLADASAGRDLWEMDRDKVLSVTLVGNPVMHHLLLGIDPTPLGAAPFLLATSDAVELPARSLDLDFPNAAVYVAPCIAGHVGADTAAAINAEGPHRSDAVQLLVDVGTNAEIVLGNSTQLYAASSPTGPAFEGAQISCGVRAAVGAVERVRIDRSTREPRFKVIGSDQWSDEPGFEMVVNDLGLIGVCGSGIIEVIGEMFLSGVIDSNGVIRGDLADPAHPEHTPRVVADERTFSYVLADATHTTQELRITQNDIRAIQLAKAALRAGIDLLMEHAEIDTVADIRLAGAFGSHIDPVYAMVLGLVPDCPVEQVTSTGNAAGVGAVRMLLSATERRDTELMVAEVDKIETATEPRFQELFVNAMAFPHKTAPNPHLASVVDLPVATAPAEGTRRRRRRSNVHTTEGGDAS